MAAKQSAPTATSSADQLLQAQAELWRHIFSHLKSTALHSAVKLGIPNAIHRCGGAASLPEILATIPVPTSKQPYLPRLMRFLTVSGVFTVDAPPATSEGAAGSPACVSYRLTPVSRLLVDDAGAGTVTGVSQSPFVLAVHLLAKGALRLGEWFGTEDAAPKNPFKMEHDVDLWRIMCLDPEFNEVFNEGMGSDTHFLMNFAIRECGEMFEGIRSLTDVGGGNGAAATTIAKAFPFIKCSVLDLPHVIGDIVPDGTVEFIVGDMMDFIPPADVVLLKNVLHDWSDEDCVKILTQCKKAIHSREVGGKVIIVEAVVGSSSRAMHEAQLLMDLLMMVAVDGKERDEQEWEKIFKDAGFSHYKVIPVLGIRSIIEWVLHDWSDEDCVKILAQCKKAIPSREVGGKVIIVDAVVGSSSGAMHEAQLLMDLQMMVATGGKERDEQEWEKIFKDAGFSHYKVIPVLGIRSIIEVYP